MRKLILQMQSSADGFVGRQGQGPDWQVWNWGPVCPWDAALKARFNAVFSDIDTILLSRKILEGGYLDHWSQFARDYGDRPDFAFTRRIVDARKIVFSNSLKESKWAGTELARRDLAQEINALKSEPGRDLIAFGGAGFASALIANGLVDEYQFYVNPIALGKGLTIFEQRGIDSSLELLESSRYACGIAVVRYAPHGRTAVKAPPARPDPPFHAGQTFNVRFPTFTPRITIRSERELTVEVIAGKYADFSDTVEYEAVAIREDLVLLSWQEHIGSTIVHVLDFTSLIAHTSITPAKGGFVRLTGRLELT